MKSILKRLITCLTLLLIITGCKKNKQEEAVIRIVTSADQAPFEFFNSTTHSIEGFDIDLAKEIAKRLGKEAMIIDMDFAGLLPSLQSGQADIAIAGFSSTLEREETVDFTDTYYRPKLAILSSIDTPITVFNHQNIGVQMGSYHKLILDDLLNKGQKFEIVTRNRLLDLVQELLSHNIQAILMDYIPAIQFMNANHGKLNVNEFIYPGGQAYAIALPKGSALKDKINHILAELKAEGFIKNLENKWLKDISLTNKESEPSK